MIITQTPLRISLFGGGTDFREFFRQHSGAVLSMGIDKYIYVIVKERFDDKIYINYSRKEIVDSVDQIQHGLVREAMKKTGVLKGVEITTLADVPSEGSGLGSSSSVTVGLLNAFYAYRGIQVTAETLARQACEIEIDILKSPIGIQDQYIAAYGNLCFFEFRKNEDVIVERLNIDHSKKNDLVSNLMLFYTNKTRSANTILSEQRKNISSHIQQLSMLRDYAYKAKNLICTDNYDQIGKLLHDSWQAKKCLASNISNPDIDLMYSKAFEAGALGGKISGAGAGGFLLLYCPVEKQQNVRAALKDYRELQFGLSRDGSKVIFNIRN